jgi:hypothetical protein
MVGEVLDLLTVDVKVRAFDAHHPDAAAGREKHNRV